MHVYYACKYDIQNKYIQLFYNDDKNNCIGEGEDHGHDV